MRSEQETAQAMERYGDTVRRLCLIHLKNQSDTEDIFQAVFLKYVLRSAAFDSPEHEKAWFIRVTLNACRDLLRSVFHSRTVPLDTLLTEPAAAAPETRDVLEAVLALPEAMRRAIYLHYYEGYTAPEIGTLLKKNTNTVYTLLRRGKEQLRRSLGGEDDA